MPDPVSPTDPVPGHIPANEPPPASDAGAAAVAGQSNARQWVAAGVVAAVVAVGVGLGISLAGGDDAQKVATADTTSAAGGGDQSTPAGQPGRGFPGGGTAGTITAIEGTTLTVEVTAESGAASTVAVETSDDTVVTESVDGTLADITVGDQITAMGETGDDGTVAASRVVDTAGLEVGGPGGGGPGGGTPPEGMGTPPEGMGTPPEGAPDGGGSARGRPGGGTSGTVTAATATSITVETADGDTVVVTVSDDTEVSVTRELDVSDLAVEDTVTVTGETTDDVVAATHIRRGELSGFLGGPGGGMAPPEGMTPPDEAGSDTTLSTFTS